MKSRLAIGSAAVAGALVLTACGGGGDAGDGEITLDFPTWQSTEPGAGEFWAAAVAEFEERHPDVTVNVQQVSFDDYQQELVTRFAANDAPAIVHLPTRFFPNFADQGFLASLDDRLAETDILDTWPAAQEQLKWNDEYQGVLLLNYGYVLYYNRDMLDGAGVAVPTTYDELLSAAETLTGDGVYGVAMDTAQHPNLLLELTWPVVGAGRHLVEDGEYTFTDPEVVAIAEQVRALSKFAPRGLVSEQKRQYFADGKAAMMIDGPFLTTQIDESVSADAIEVARAPFPTVPGALSNSLHVGAGISDEEADLAWDFIEMVTHPEWQDTYSENVGVPAPREGSGAEAVAADPRMEIFAEVVTEAVDVVPNDPAVQLDYPAFSEEVSLAVSRLVSTDDPVADIMSELQTALEQDIPLSE